MKIHAFFSLSSSSSTLDQLTIDIDLRETLAECDWFFFCYEMEEKLCERATRKARLSATLANNKQLWQSSMKQNVPIA